MDIQVISIINSTEEDLLDQSIIKRLDLGLTQIGVLNKSIINNGTDSIDIKFWVDSSEKVKIAENLIREIYNKDHFHLEFIFKTSSSGDF
ncbi:hypothetical protein LVD15_10115 [Fulvivirga maritima]|uniref:hypothetical protein n=1 Tax=Fulvivirga maritima TaxID=2904247 RepID=UPI001F313A2F|nr:hypothetical protein [Fulvivirga maritima]UII28756.1 hypothetical protein LVD15_10115 [Fulvivirga maritima]